MTKKKKVTAAATALVAMALLFAGSYAWVSTLQTATNQFRKSDYNVRLHDVFEKKEVVTDVKGENISEMMEWTEDKKTLDKDIWVTNEGSDDVLVRIRLIENMTIKENNSDEATIGKKDAIHVIKDVSSTMGDNCKNMHQYVEWTTQNIKTYAQWEALEESAKTGSYWVVNTDGWAYWMQPLQPSDPSQEAKPDITGNTGLLLDAVTLKSDVEGRMNYSIKVEMDAIDAALEGLGENRTGENRWGVNVTARKLIAYSSGKLEPLQAKLAASSSTGAKKLYKNAINLLKSGNHVQSGIKEELGDLAQKNYDKNASELDNPVQLTGENGILEDTELANVILTTYGTDGTITKDQLQGIDALDLTGKNITSLKGLSAEYFPNLHTLWLKNNPDLEFNEIKNLDAKLKKQIHTLDIGGTNPVDSALDLSDYANLKILYAGNKSIQSITALTPSLEVLEISGTSITGDMDIGNFPNLKALYASGALVRNFMNTDKLGCLEFVDMRDMKNITAISFPNSHNLCHINANGCSNLASMALSTEIVTNPMAHSGGSINEAAESPYIDIRNCPSLTSIDISKVLKVNYINLNNCTSMETITKREDQNVYNIPEGVTLKYNIVE